MKLQNLQNAPQFGGINIAAAKVKLPQKVTKFELYKVTSQDYSFIRQLVDTLDIKSLLPKLNDADSKLWTQIMSRLAQIWTNQETFLITRDGIPCGGLKYSKNRYNYHIDARVTWPIDKGVKEPLAGKAMTLTLFKLFMHDNLSMIRTCVVKNNTFNTVSKCRDLGFGSAGGDNYNELMSIKRDKIPQIIEKFQPIVEIEEKILIEDIPLANFLKIKKS